MLNVLLLLSLFSLSLGDPEDTSSCSSNYINGPFTWSNGGTTTNSFIIQAGGVDSWGDVTVSGSTVSLDLNPRIYLANQCAGSFGTSVFQKINPLGSTISFTVNLANVGCGADASFYLVGMPAPSSGSNGDYYCDANCVGGYCCTEMDLIEANRHALQITAHKCTSLTSGCDAGGCARNTKNIPNGFGPGSNFQINTENSFNVAITFKTTSGQLSSITSVISQGTNSITITHDSSCGSGYLSGLDQALSYGMVPVWSFWSGGMSWLDSPACSSDNDEIPSSQLKFVFSNLVVTGAGKIVSPPPPPPTPPASQYCGSNGCTTNINWVEFTPPSGASNPAASTASVQCTSGSYSCSWDSGGNKFQCSCPGSVGCANPIPVFNGKLCPFQTSSSGVLADDTTQSNGSGLNTATIVGITVGCVGLMLLIVIIVVVVMKKRKAEETV
jgi:hypothetical protein